MDRYTLISADCHAGPLPDQVRSYVDPKHRDAFDAWVNDEEATLARRAQHTGEAIYGDEAMGDFDAEDAVAHGGMDGAWDSKRRVEEMNGDGVVGEVIFPGGSKETIAPWGAGLMTYQYELDAALWLEGCRSYNRWLVDFCAETPGQRAGVGLITVDDIETTMSDIQWQREQGLTGGIILPVHTNGQPYYNHPRYEPLWAVCRDLEVPIHTHSGWTPNYGNFDGSLGIFLHEIGWFAHRPMHYLIWSGVFERYPELEFVMTEQGATWVIEALASLDKSYEMPMFRHLRRKLPKKPSEYFRSNCFIGAAFLDGDAADARYDIGVDQLMWGSDYPHIEGTWPHTAEKLTNAFQNVPKDEAAKVLGLTAASVYDFDLDKMNELASEFGPETNTIGR
jgi:predicted TIM-barrel fold metal-dependent hydrolase